MELCRVLLIIYMAFITAILSSMPYYTKLSATTYTWSEAKQACEDYGTALATIQDSADRVLVDQLCSTGNTYCWIGLTTQDSCDGCWYWVGEHSSTYYMWYTSQPSITTDACVAFYTYSSGYYFTRNCLSTYYAICNPLTTAPTAAPSAAPTFSPTAYGDDCEERGYIYHHDWDDTSTTQQPAFSYNININPSDLSVTFEATLQYIGFSSAKSVYGLGSTYVLDFAPFDAFNDRINEARNCANRLPESFVNKTFAEYWSYSTKPYQLHHYGTTDYLAYPPSGNKWALTMDAGNPWTECAFVKYVANFDWIELTQCVDNEDAKLMDVGIDSDFITLSGRFYIDLVSPKSNNEELNVYYVQPVLQKSFAIKVSRYVDVIDSTNIESFLITIYQAYRLFDFAHSTYGSYMIRISTQIAHYMQLTAPLIITSPKYQWQIRDVNDEQCIFERDSICTQYWEAYMPSVDCPLLFSGLFHLHFSAICNIEVNATEECDDYMTAYNDTVELEFILSYTDPFQCNNTKVGQINFDGSMLFYNDNQFNDLTSNNDQFLSGIDIIYGEVIINIPNNSYSIFEASLINIWICTVNPMYANQVEIDQSNPLFSGCFDSVIVDSGSTQNVMSNGISQLNFDAQPIDSDNATNIVRYSFLTPSWAARDSLYIHCQIQISLIDGSRRLLDVIDENHKVPDFGDVQSMVHVVKNVFINDKGEEYTSTKQIISEDVDSAKSEINLVILVCVGIVILMVSVMVICCIWWVKKKRNNKVKFRVIDVFETGNNDQCENEIIQRKIGNDEDVNLDYIETLSFDDHEIKNEVNGVTLI